MKDCPEDKERNPLTRRCVKKCEEGKERSLVSGQCVKPCPKGQTRSLISGHCKVDKTRKNRRISSLSNDINYKNHNSPLKNIKHNHDTEQNSAEILQLHVEDQNSTEILQTQLKEQYENCVSGCNAIKKEYDALLQKNIHESIKLYGLSSDKTLVDLLIERVLDPREDWKEKLEFLINIPHGLPGDNILRGGDYFEALFQLVFAINASSRITGNLKFWDIDSSYTKLHEFKGNYNGQQTDSYLYGKSIRNSGGTEQGVSDITIQLCKNSDCKPYENNSYICGDTESAQDISIDADNEYYFFSIKGFVKEKSLKGKYDVEPISLQIKNIKNASESLKSKICVGVRNKREFEMHVKGARIGWLADMVNEIFSIDEVMEDLKLFRIRFFGKYYPTYITQKDLNSISKTEIRKLVIEQEFPLHVPQKPALQLYFHQELVSQAVIQRIQTVKGKQYIAPHYMCIGVLPRGGKSYIAGGIMDQYMQQLGKKQMNVMFLTSAVTETISQFKDDLIEKFSDFENYTFVDIRKNKINSDTNNFVFLSRQYVGSNAEDKADEGEGLKKELNALMNKASKIEFDLIFFDEAHIGAGSKHVDNLLKTMFETFHVPVIFMTATYKKPVSILNIKPDDLFVWDLYDIRDMKQLSLVGYDAFVEHSNSDIVVRYGNIARNVLMRRKILGETPEEIARPYVKFPQPVFISPTIREVMQTKIRETGYDSTMAFAIQPIHGNRTHEALLNDITKWKDWGSLLVNKEHAKQIREYLTFNPSNEESAFADIFAHGQLHSALRPVENKPFSVLMFLPMTTESVGALCRIWGSFMLDDKWIRAHFVVMVLSPYSSRKHEGGALELLQIGGEKDTCVDNGICIRTSDELKKQIVEIERKALQKGKGLLLLSGDVAKMGISLPCVDVVCLLDNGAEADDIIQKMFRALTDSPNKEYGYVVDMNITRIISAMIEYDIQKDTQRKEKRVKFIGERLNELMESCDWGQNIYTARNIKNEGFDYEKMMDAIRKAVLDKIVDKYLDDAISTLDKEDQEMQYAPELMNVSKELFEIFRNTLVHDSPKSKIEFVKGIEFIPNKKTKVGDEKTDQGKKEASKQEKKSEEEIRKAILQKALNARKTFINILILMTYNDQNDESITIDDMLATYKKDKTNTLGAIGGITEDALSTISFRCNKAFLCEAINVTNVFDRVYSQVFSYLKGIENPYENTLKVLELIESMFVRVDVQFKWLNYVDLFIRKMKRLPEQQLSPSHVGMEGGGLSSNKRYNHILKVIDEHLIPDVTAKDERGEVFTPPDLVREMLFGLSKKALKDGVSKIWGIDDVGNFVDADEDDRVGGLPTEVWRNPTLKWLDPANGIGNFPIIAFYKLDYELQQLKEWRDDDKRRKHIIENMLFMMELDKGNVAICRSLFKKIHPDAKPNICCCDSLAVTYEKMLSMFGVNKFDIIIGNPPFNTGGLLKGGGTLWPLFVKKAFELVGENGYICFVHPPGWRKFYNAEDRDNQGKLWYLIRKNGWNINYINISDQPPMHFPIVDHYVIHAKKTNNHTNYNSKFMGRIDFGETILNYSFIPNMLNNETMGILKKLFNAKGDPIHIIYNQAFKPSISDKGNTGIPHYHFTSRTGEKHIYKKEYSLVPEYIAKEKVIMTYNGGYEKGKLFAFYSDKKMGTTNNSMYMLTKSKAHGDKLVKFFNSDIITFLMKITQYSASPNHKNEFKILNQLQVPDSMDYGLTEKEEELIKVVVRKNDELVRGDVKHHRSTRKAKPTKGGRFNRTYRHRC